MRWEVEQWLGTLDPDEEERNLAFDHHQVRDFRAGPWTIELTAYPKAVDQRGVDEDPIGPFVPSYGDGIDDIEPIREALDDKASKYGRLDRAYVIALLSRRDLLEPTDVEQALFGRLQVRYTERILPTDVARSWWERDGAGFFDRSNREGHPGVSGVLVVQRLEPWRVGDETPQLWVNPGADRSAPPIAGVTVIRKVGDSPGLTRVPAAERMHEVFGLDPGWPHFSARWR